MSEIDRDIEDTAGDVWERIDGQDERPISTIAAALQTERDRGYAAYAERDAAIAKGAELKRDLDCARRERDEVIARATKAEGKVAAAESHMRTEVCRAMQSEKRVRELERECGDRLAACSAAEKRVSELQAELFKEHVDALDRMRERDTARRVALVLATYAPHTDEHQAARAAAVGYAGLKLPDASSAEPEVAP